MAAFQKQLSARAGGAVDGAGLTVGIVHTRWNKPARRSSAEHLIATKALHCTATAWMLIVAQCSAIP